MEFPFPAIMKVCPICGRACGAIYRGYYQRWMICPLVLFVGRVAVRTAYCKHEKKRFALFPRFLIPFRSFSREGFLKLWTLWKEKQSSLENEVDSWFSSMEQEVCLSVSTIHSQLRLILRQFRAGQVLLGIPPTYIKDLSFLLSDFPTDLGSQAILHKAFGLAANFRIDPPP